MIGLTMSGILRVAALVLIANSVLVVGPAMGERFGRFEGSVQVEWLDDGRYMKTISKISYIDPQGRAWVVPAGIKTDGASTPQASWTMYPPYAGKYRKAALIHDYYCEIKTRSWEDTHDMFYSALRASGMDALNSNIMWGAVYMQGPRWQVGKKRSLRMPAEALTPAQAQQDFELMADWIRKAKPSRRQIAQAISEGKFQKTSTAPDSGK